MIKKTYKISGMDCESCAKMVELDLEDGGFVAKCSINTETLEVEIDPNKNEESKIQEIVETAGYKLQAINN